MSDWTHRKRTHGRPGTYTAGCSCCLCREAWRLYTAKRRAAQRERADSTQAAEPK